MNNSDANGFDMTFWTAEALTRLACRFPCPLIPIFYEAA